MRQGGRVFRAELEDVADLDAFGSLQFSAVILRRGITRHGVADVGDGGFFRVGQGIAAFAKPVEIFDVVVNLIGAGGP